jgi:Holliday junction resolvase-like predicted endonuclease
MTEEGPEGFAKPGTTLEGRVAQLLRLMGYNVTRNVIIRDHEIDVFGEKENHKIIVECKEYYTQLISRDLILIFATKIRDIMPDEAWFVTINDFDSSALELSKRYSIRSINGYDLEQLEDEAIKLMGNVELGRIPPEDKLLRLLKRRRTELSREKMRINEIQKTMDQIASLRIQRIDLPPYLYPTTESDLEEKYIWLSDLEKMPKEIEEGHLYDIDVIINVGEQLYIKGFKITREVQRQLSYLLIAFIWIVSIFIMYQQGLLYEYASLIYLVIPIILSIIVFYFKEHIVQQVTQTINRPVIDAEIGKTSITFPRSSKPFADTPGDLSSQNLYNLDLNLIDETHLGISVNYVVEKETWTIKGVLVNLPDEISEEVGMDSSIIPTHDISFVYQNGQIEMTVKAIYVLGEIFLKERKRV